jgi:predicted enzyme related to lactoylglutathione lyase
MNSICHVEIPCTDFEKMRDFYGKVFGWETEIVPGMEYAIFRCADGIGGGFSKQARIGVEPGISIYIEVADINEALRKIEKSGGRTIHGRSEISPDFGYFAVFSDIEGNAVGLWSQG